MRTSMTRRQRGIVFVAAILALGLMVVIGTAFMASAVQQLRDARRDLDSLHALAMADAGLNYFIWRQRFSSNPITNPHDVNQITGNIRDLQPAGTPNPQVPLGAVALNNEDRVAVWLFSVSSGSQVMYQVVSKGYYRDTQQTVRAMLQGPAESNSVTPPPPPTPPAWLDYAIFSESQMIINTSTDVTGDIASNGSIIMNTSGGSTFKGNLRAASTVQLMKNSTSIDGGLAFGTRILDSKGKDISGDASKYFTGDINRLPDDADKKIHVDPMNPQAYAEWADAVGNAAKYDSTTLSDPARVTTPILYVNGDMTPGFSLRITTDLKGPLTIFVNGDVDLRGSVVLGSKDAPVTIIATGNIQCNGNPSVYGAIWASGSFGGGTPNVYGSVRCDVLGSFQGNPSINYQTYAQDIINPPPPPGPTDTQNLWALTSWQLL